MQTQTLSKSNNQLLRYEKKWICTNISYEEIYCKISRLNFYFREVFNKRIVNSVYYDFPNYASIIDNVEGEANRKKYRVRWYGNSKYEKKFFFEIKYKSGFRSFKKRKEILLNKEIDITDPKNFEKLKDKFDLNFKIKRLLSPKIYINYKRTYLVSSNNLIRCTLDQDISFKRISFSQMGFSKKLRSHIIEIKYNTSLDNYFRNNLPYFPFRYSKSSKYVMCMLYFKNLYFN